jgi:hypothetical protein
LFVAAPHDLETHLGDRVANGGGRDVRLRRRISKRIRRTAEGINLAADINADVSVNSTEVGQRRVPKPPPGSDAERKQRGKENQ